MSLTRLHSPRSITSSTISSASSSIRGVSEHDAGLVGTERLRLAADDADIVVTGDRPETRTIGLRVEVHRIVGAQPRVFFDRRILERVLCD